MPFGDRSASVGRKVKRKPRPKPVSSTAPHRRRPNPAVFGSLDQGPALHRQQKAQRSKTRKAANRVASSTDARGSGLPRYPTIAGGYTDAQRDLIIRATRRAARRSGLDYAGLRKTGDRETRRALNKLAGAERTQTDAAIGANILDSIVATPYSRQEWKRRIAGLSQAERARVARDNPGVGLSEFSLAGLDDRRSFGDDPKLGPSPFVHESPKEDDGELFPGADFIGTALEGPLKVGKAGLDVVGGGLDVAKGLLDRAVTNSAASVDPLAKPRVMGLFGREPRYQEAEKLKKEIRSGTQTVLDQAMRFAHANANAALYAGQGKDVSEGYRKGFTLKEKTLGSDVLKEAGAPKWLQFAGGLAFDIGTDPLNLATGGFTSAAREAGQLAARESLAASERAVAAKGLEYGTREFERARQQAQAKARKAAQEAAAKHDARRGLTVGLRGPAPATARRLGKRLDPSETARRVRAAGRAAAEQARRRGATRDVVRAERKAAESAAYRLARPNAKRDYHADPHQATMSRPITFKPHATARDAQRVERQIDDDLLKEIGRRDRAGVGAGGRYNDAVIHELDRDLRAAMREVRGPVARAARGHQQALDKQILHNATLAYEAGRLDDIPEPLQKFFKRFGEVLETSREAQIRAGIRIGDVRKFQLRDVPEVPDVSPLNQAVKLARREEQAMRDEIRRPYREAVPREVEEQVAAVQERARIARREQSQILKEAKAQEKAGDLDAAQSLREQSRAKGREADRLTREWREQANPVAALRRDIKRERRKAGKSVPPLVRRAERARGVAARAKKPDLIPLASRGGYIPPISEGHVRLYRGEGVTKFTRGEWPDAPEGVGPTHGRWFTPDIERAEGYTKFANVKDGYVKFVDVPEDVARKFLHEQSKKPTYILPPDLAKRAVELESGSARKAQADYLARQEAAARAPEIRAKRKAARDALLGKNPKASAAERAEEATAAEKAAIERLAEFEDRARWAKDLEAKALRARSAQLRPRLKELREKRIAAEKELKIAKREAAEVRKQARAAQAINDRTDKIANYVPRIERLDMDPEHLARPGAAGREPGVRHQRARERRLLLENEDPSYVGQIITDDPIAIVARYLGDASRSQTRTRSLEEFTEVFGVKVHDLDTAVNLGGDRKELFYVKTKSGGWREMFPGRRELKIETVERAIAEGKDVRVVSALHFDRLMAQIRRGRGAEIPTVAPDPTSSFGRALVRAGGAGRFFDRNVQGPLKTLQTVVNPGYYVTNQLGDTMNSRYAGTRLSDMAVYLFGGLGKQTKRVRAERVGELLEEAIYGKTRYYPGLGRTATDREIAQMAYDHGAAGMGLAEYELHSLMQGRSRRGVMETVTDGRSTRSPMARIRDMNERREDIARVATFRRALLQGKSPDEATKWANAHLIDYSDLRPTELWIRRFIPFYTFGSRNMVIQAKGLLERPGQVANIEKLREELAVAAGLEPDFSKELPKYSQAGIPFAVPYLDSALRKVGIDLPEGLPIIAYAKLPTSDLELSGMLGAGSSPMNTVDRFTDELFNQIAQRSSPLFKIPIERATGFNFFFREKDPKRVPAPDFADKIPFVRDYIGEERDERTGKMVNTWPVWMDKLARMIPASNLGTTTLTTARTKHAADPALGILGYFLGTRPAIFDKDEARVQRLYSEWHDLSEWLDEHEVDPAVKEGRKKRGERVTQGKVGEVRDRQLEILHEVWGITKAAGYKYPKGVKPAAKKKPATPKTSFSGPSGGSLDWGS